MRTSSTPSGALMRVYANWKGVSPQLVTRRPFKEALIRYARVYRSQKRVFRFTKRKFSVLCMKKESIRDQSVYWQQCVYTAHFLGEPSFNCRLCCWWHQEREYYGPCFDVALYTVHPACQTVFLCSICSFRYTARIVEHLETVQYFPCVYYQTLFTFPIRKQRECNT